MSSDSPTLDDQSEFSSAESLPTAEGELDAPPLDVADAVEAAPATAAPDAPARPESTADRREADLLDEPESVLSPPPPQAVLSSDDAVSDNIVKQTTL